jgi:hypothetical protein
MGVASLQRMADQTSYTTPFQTPPFTQISSDPDSEGGGDVHGTGVLNIERDESLSPLVSRALLSYTRYYRSLSWDPCHCVVALHGRLCVALHWRMGAP